MPFPPSRPRRAVAWPVIVALAMMSASLLFTAVAVTGPQETMAYTYRTEAPICNIVYARKKATTSVARTARLDPGDRVYVVGTVTGASWASSCSGSMIRSSIWNRITKINGKSVKSLYGVTYLYAPAKLFRIVAYSKAAACDGVGLRTKATTSATRKTSINEGTIVTFVATVSGGAWKTTCAGKTVSGSSWYRISTVGGKKVSSLFGLSYVYAATGLFTSGGSSSAPAPDPTPTPPPGTTFTEGIDVSHWQGTIDWAKVRAAGKKFAYIKASETTTFVDDHYVTNRAKAKSNGIKVGAYHFARPGTNSGDAAAEADHFVNTAGPVSGELIPVLDLEVTGGLTDSQLANWAKAFLDRVYQRTGVRGAVYTSPSFWSNNVGNSRILADAGYKVLWIAHWTTASSPTLPAENWGGNSWTFWQYTSDGAVSGISGRVDLNRYKGTDFTKVLIP